MTYKFICKTCGEFEANLSVANRDSVKECPLCHSIDINRVYTPVNTIWRCGGNFGKSK